MTKQDTGTIIQSLKSNHGEMLCKDSFILSSEILNRTFFQDDKTGTFAF